MLWLLEAKARATPGVSVAVTMVAISPHLLVVLSEALDQPALGEVMPVCSVDLAPLAGSLFRQDQLLRAPAGFFPVGACCGLLLPG
jgi:hypothetical protein